VGNIDREGNSAIIDYNCTASRRKSVSLQKKQTIMGNAIDWNKYKQASDEEKIQILKDGAGQGDALCQLGYGCMLKKDSPTEARRWFEL